MAKHVEQYVPWRVLLYVYNRLMEIGHDGGYNTQPSVTLDYEAFKRSTTDAALLVEVPQMSIVENDIGDGVTGATRPTPELMVTVMGSVDYAQDNPQLRLMALLQDVQTALSASVKAMRTTIGTGFTMRLGSASMVYGLLDAKNEAVFRLEVVYRYQQSGSEW